MPKVAVGNKFLSRNQQRSLFHPPGQVRWTGTHSPPDPEVYYEHPRGTLWVGDSVKWLGTLTPASVDLVFADPPYNIGKADWDCFDSHDEYLVWCLEWIELASRALKPSGSLFVCGFSEVLADLRRPAAKMFARCRWLVWYYKNKGNLSNDWGRSHESILHLRKSADTRISVDAVRVPYGRHTTRYPEHPQAESSQYGGGKKPADAWTPNPLGAKPRDVIEVPVTSNGMDEKTPHPTQKPEELLRKFILAASEPDGHVIDPFSGSGTTLVCAQQLGRRWAGCELSPEYCSWASLRLDEIPSDKTAEDWITFDRSIAERRASIR